MGAAAPLHPPGVCSRCSPPASRGCSLALRHASRVGSLRFASLPVAVPPRSYPLRLRLRCCTLRPGSRGHNRPHPGRMGPCFDAGPYPLLCAALAPQGRVGPRGAFFAQGPSGAWPAAACALRAASGPARAARPPLRGPGPAFSPSALFGPRRGRASLAAPPLPRSARVRACALRGRSLAPSAFGPGLAVLRAPAALLWLPLRRAALALVQRVAPRGVCCAPLRASGPVGSRPGPPACLAARCFPLCGAGAFGCARGPARACRPGLGALPLPPRCLGLRGALARLRSRRSATVAAPRRAGAGSRVGFSPAPLPSPPPPLGAPGECVASGLGAPAPPLRGSPPTIAASVARPVAALRLAHAAFWGAAGCILVRLLRPLGSIPPPFHYPQRVKATPWRARSGPGLDPLRAFFVRRA